MEIKAKTLVKVIAIILAGLIGMGILYLAYKKIWETIRVKKVKQAYSLLSNSYSDSVKAENFQWKKDSMNTIVFAKGFLKHLDVKKDCGLNSNEVCFAKQLHYLRPLGTTSWSPMEGFYKVELNNGMNIAFKVLSPDCSYIRGRCASIFVDINGMKGPNQLGTDTFDFAIFKKELKPYEAEIVHRDRCLEGNGQGCADFILRYGNMNYQKFDKYMQKEGKFFIKK